MSDCRFGISPVNYPDPDRKVEKHFLKGFYFFTSSPTSGHEPWGQESWNESQPSSVPMVQIWVLSDEWLSRYELLKT